MLEPSQPPQIDHDRYMAIIHKVGPDIIDIFEQFKAQLGGALPEELSYGMVAGYLRGKGHTWEECFVGMNRYIQIIEGMNVVKPIAGKMTIQGTGDSASFNYAP